MDDRGWEFLQGATEEDKEKKEKAKHVAMMKERRLKTRRGGSTVKMRSDAGQIMKAEMNGKEEGQRNHEKKILEEEKQDEIQYEKTHWHRSTWQSVRWRAPLCSLLDQVMHEICSSISAALAPCAHCEAERGGEEDGGDVSGVAGGLLESTKIFYKRRRVGKVLLLEDPEVEEKDEEHEEEGAM